MSTIHGTDKAYPCSSCGVQRVPACRRHSLRDPDEQRENLNQMKVDSMCQQYMEQIKRILVLHAECKEYQLAGDTLYVKLLRVF